MSLPALAVDKPGAHKRVREGAKGLGAGLLKIGVTSAISPVDAVRYSQDLVDYLSGKLGVPVKMVSRRSYEEMEELLDKGEVDIAFVGAVPHVRDVQALKREMLVVPRVNGETYYNTFIIVHRESRVKSFDELKGGSFAFTDPRSNSGWLYPVYRLAKEGYSPEVFFDRFVFTYNHDKSIELVAKSEVDGAAVDSMVFTYMQRQNSPYVGEVKIIERSPKQGISPVVSTPEMPEPHKEKIKEIFTNMDRDPEGRKILDTMLIDGFVEASPGIYASIAEMEAFVEDYKVPKAVGEKAKAVIKFGVIPRDNPRIAYEKYQPIIDYLSEETPYTFELVLKKTYAETVNALGRGEIDVAILGPLTYIEAHDRFGADSILKSITSKGEPFSRSIIVARKDNPAQSLSALKGGRFAFASLKSTSGNLIPRYMLAADGIHLKELEYYRNFNYHDSVIKRVLRGEYDAGAVREAVAEKYMNRGLKIIAVSNPIPTGPVVVNPNTSKEIVRELSDALMRLNDTDGGRQMLMGLDPEMSGGFVQASDSDYEAVRQMIKGIPRTCGAGCHPGGGS